MTGKRRDNKGRVLRTGENQRKDGKYEYKYTDIKGVRRSVYSWKLVDTDTVPKGKRCTEALRNIEKRLQRDIEEGIDTFKGESITLNECFTFSLQKRAKLKPTTINTYTDTYGRYIRKELGDKRIISIKPTHLYSIYASMLSRGLKPATVECLHAVLTPVFKLAKKNCWIRADPTEGLIAELKNEFSWDKTKKKALTEEQQEIFINCVKESRWYSWLLPLFTFLLGTGCRIGETLGLRWEDCDFSAGFITIRHTLVYKTAKSDPQCYHLGATKSVSGMRQIPMLSEVKAALLRLRTDQLATGFGTRLTIDGYKGFVFVSKQESIIRPRYVNNAILSIIMSYNERELIAAAETHRDPCLLPRFSAHTLRHTFCTRFCENETNLKVIQDIMGHKNISITMEVYNEATEKKKKESFAKLEGKIKVC
ncbi:MAG: integrase DNA-binding domain-containing protein [Faecousia sp.]